MSGWSDGTSAPRSPLTTALTSCAAQMARFTAAAVHEQHTREHQGARRTFDAISQASSL